MHKRAWTAWVVGGILGAAVILGGSAVRAAGPIAYPAGYRHWTHVKSMLILPGHKLAAAFGGLHHVYVNDQGLGALLGGKPFPDGSVLVFDLLAATEQDHAYVEGARKFTAVMVKNRKRFSSTGGWGFEVFKAGEKTGSVKNAASECFGCHQQAKATDYVFSRYRP